MRGCALTLGCLGLVLGYAAAGTGIVATLVHFAHQANQAGRTGAVLPVGQDALVRELVRCQHIGTMAADDARCQAAWTENRRLFFDYGHSTRVPQQSTAEAPKDRLLP
jgi:conjugative transfer region protein TrbK